MVLSQSMPQKNFYFGHDQLTPLVALSLASGKTRGQINQVTRKKILNSAASVQKIVARGTSVYGINTGFGPLCRTAISKKDTKKLQENILRSHSVGVGVPIDEKIAKLMLVLKAQSLCFGYSGVTPDTVARILWHIDNDVIPLVPCQGSVGASGDLAPLAHLFLPLIGLGEVNFEGKVLPTEVVLKKFKLEPLELGPKEGLALINGTQFILAHAVVIAERLFNVLEAADIIGALSLEAMLGSAAPFKEKLHDLRPFAGAKLVAGRLRTLLKNSKLVESHTNCDRVQDPYSLRCMPQVHGASREAWAHLHGAVVTELNSVTDNPIIFSADETVSGGNFHGQPLALPLDYAALAASEIGNISDRRIYLMLEGRDGLPLLLMQDTGINSGFMIPQYTSAALASENKSLCFPASADSIPTSVGQEDHVSMGSISARKTLRIIENLENILAVELMCAAQAFDFRRPLKSSPILEACHELIRGQIDHADQDRIFSDDIKKAHAIVTSGDLVACANKAAKNGGVDLNVGYEQFNLL